jgi:hypothetical protein
MGVQIRGINISSGQDARDPIQITCGAWGVRVGWMEGPTGVRGPPFFSSSGYPSEGGLRRAGFRQDCIQLCRIGIGAQLGADIGIPHCPADQRQRLQMIHAGILGRKQPKDQINRLTVDES